MAQQLPIDFWTEILRLINNANNPQPPPRPAPTPGAGGPVLSIGVSLVIGIVAQELERFLRQQRGIYDENAAALEVINCLELWLEMQADIADMIDPEEGQARARQLAPYKRRQRKRDNNQRWRIWGHSRARKGTR